jgi:hypothetical protein
MIGDMSFGFDGLMIRKTASWKFGLWPNDRQSISLTTAYVCKEWVKRFMLEWLHLAHAWSIEGIFDLCKLNPCYSKTKLRTLRFAQKINEKALS